MPIVRHHHENWDGTGYPDGLKGEEIPIGARILSVVDCFDALTSDPRFARRMTDTQALKIIRDRRGLMHDPAIVDAFVADYTRIMPDSSAAPHPRARDRRCPGVRSGRAGARRSRSPRRRGSETSCSRSRACHGR